MALSLGSKYEYPKEKGVIMEEITRKFVFDRPTKNTVRYSEEPAGGEAPVVGTLYVQKWALGNQPPQVIVITMKEG